MTLVQIEFKKQKDFDRIQAIQKYKDDTGEEVDFSDYHVMVDLLRLTKKAEDARRK